MSELKKVTLKITGMEKKVASNGSVFFNIKDENNKNFKLWKSVKDGSDSKAYVALMKLPNEGLGQTIDAAVEFEEGEYQGKSVTYKTIKMIGPADTFQFPEKATPQTGQGGLKLTVDLICADKLQLQQLMAFTENLNSFLTKKTPEQVPTPEFEPDSEEDIRVDEIPF